MFLTRHGLCSVDKPGVLSFDERCTEGRSVDKKRAIEEMFRVAKNYGRIVFGDEGVAPWLRKSNYGKILISNNEFYGDEAPVDILPVDARDVTVRWVLGGAFYLVDMTVGEGEPFADFDYEIPGARGGTLKTRYHGKLEGVTPKTKKLANAAREKSAAWAVWIVRK